MGLNKKRLKTSDGGASHFEKSLIIKYPLLRTGAEDLELLKSEYYQDRKFDGISGNIDLLGVDLMVDKKEGRPALLVLKMRLHTSDYVADFEAPFIANAIIEKFDEKRALGKPSSSKVIGQD